MHEPSTRLRTAFSLGARLAVLMSALGASLIARAQTPTAHAQAPIVVLIPVGNAGEHGARWQARIERQHEPTGPRVVPIESIPAVLSLPTQTIDRQDLDRLGVVESHLIRARTHAAQLAEGDALTELLAAGRVIESLQHVPGTSAFYAEVQTAIGLVAAQAGLNALADASLRRAAVVDPSRGVRAAETTPAWLERAAAIAREVAVGPIGELQVTANAIGARVYLDDNLQGTAPTTVRASRGVHILRIEAEGRRAFGMFLPVDAGARPPVHALLDHDPVVVALQSLARGASAGASNEVHAGLAALRDLGAPIDAAWLFRSSERRTDRALLIRCTAAECGPNQRLELDPSGSDPERYGQTLDPAGLRSLTGQDRDARDLAWLNRVEPRPTAPAQRIEHPEWWQRWYVWTATAVVLGAAATVGIAASQETEPRRLRVTIQP